MQFELYGWKSRALFVCEEDELETKDWSRKNGGTVNFLRLGMRLASINASVLAAERKRASKTSSFFQQPAHFLRLIADPVPYRRLSSIHRLLPASSLSLSQAAVHRRIPLRYCCPCPAIQNQTSQSDNCNFLHLRTNSPT